VLPASGVVSSRTQALLAASALILGTGGPGVALAAEPDQEQDGTATPGQTGGSDPATDPDFDPGGDSTDLPPVAPPSSPAPPSASDDDSAPPEPEPTGDADAPIVDPGDSESAGPEPPPPPDDASPPTAGSAPPAAPVAVAPAPLEPTPAPTAVAEVPAAQLIAHKLRGHKTVLMEPRRATGARPAPPSRRAPGGAAAAISRARVSESSPAAARTGRMVSRDARDTGSGDRVHVVQAGESLWSIANDVLGGDAEPARVAREVDRLWRLNEERIGTGDPDLLAIGTRLRLR
jgi:hypothetical protein